MTAVVRRTGAASAVFYALAIAGALVAGVLAVRTADDTAPVEIGEVVDRREGNDTMVEAEVVNVSDSPRCPEIRAAARDRGARDLAEAKAEPDGGVTRLAPGERRVYRARLTLNEQEYAEDLDEFSVYTYELHDC